MGGFKNIQPHEGVKFSSERQPKNRRQSTKFLTDLLKKQLASKTEMLIEGIDTVTGLKTTITVSVPTQESIIAALLKQADKGNILAIKEVLDRVEGKAMQAVEVTGKDGDPIQHQVITGMTIL